MEQLSEVSLKEEHPEYREERGEIESRTVQKYHPCLRKCAWLTTASLIYGVTLSVILYIGSVLMSAPLVYSYADEHGEAIDYTLKAPFLIMPYLSFASFVLYWSHYSAYKIGYSKGGKNSSTPTSEV